MKKIIILIAIILILVVGAVFLMNPSKQDTKINVVTNDTLHMGSSFLVMLADSNNNPIANESLSVKVIDSNSKVIVDKQINTNNQGIAALEVDDISSGNYTIEMTFKGNDKYNNCTFTHKLVVEDGSTEPVQIDTSSQNSTNKSATNTSTSSGSSSSSSDNGAFYSAQSERTYYTGEVDLGPDGHHWKHMGNNEWVRID